jgi:hypothetical protein
VLAPVHSSSAWAELNITIILFFLDNIGSGKLISNKNGKFCRLWRTITTGTHWQPTSLPSRTPLQLRLGKKMVEVPVRVRVRKVQASSACTTHCSPAFAALVTESFVDLSRPWYFRWQLNTRIRLQITYIINGTGIVLCNGTRWKLSTEDLSRCIF